MALEPIEYVSDWVDNDDDTRKFCLEESEKDGLKWDWRFYQDNSDLCMEWKFDWKELEEKHNVVGFNGYILASWLVWQTSHCKSFDVKLTRSGKWIDHQICDWYGTYRNQKKLERRFQFDFVLTPVIEEPKKMKLAQNLKLSDGMADGVLVVEGNKIPVNKTLLSFHSEFFNTLFNSDFKEKAMEEIPIEDVKYKDFTDFLSMIHTNPVFPTDATAEMFLKLADRFMMPTVTRHVEFYLMNSDMEQSQKLALADKYRLEKLLEVTFVSLETRREIISFTRTPEFDTLSDALKVKLLNRLLEIN